MDDGLTAQNSTHDEIPEYFLRNISSRRAFTPYLQPLHFFLAKSNPQQHIRAIFRGEKASAFESYRFRIRVGKGPGDRVDIDSSDRESVSVREL